MYVVDVDGGLTYFPFDLSTPAWTFTQTEPRRATSGPVVSSEDRIYYTLEDRIQAVSSTGEDLFRVRLTDMYAEEPPRISPQGTFAFLLDGAIYARGGGRVDISGITDKISPENFILSPRFFIGADEKTYLALGHGAYLWHSTKDGLVMDGYAERKIPATVSGGYLMPNDFGVLPSGLLWLFYSNDFTDTELHSVDFSMNQMLQSFEQRLVGTKMIGIDPRAVAYMCGSAFGPSTCVAVKLGSSTPEWDMDMEAQWYTGRGACARQALRDKRDGILFALGDKNEENKSMTFIIKNGTLITASETFQADILIDGGEYPRSGITFQHPQHK